MAIGPAVPLYLHPNYLAPSIMNLIDTALGQHVVNSWIHSYLVQDG